MAIVLSMDYNVCAMVVQQYNIAIVLSMDYNVCTMVVQ